MQRQELHSIDNAVLQCKLSRGIAYWSKFAARVTGDLGLGFSNNFKTLANSQYSAPNQIYVNQPSKVEIEDFTSDDITDLELDDGQIVARFNIEKLEPGTYEAQLWFTLRYVGTEPNNRRNQIKVTGNFMELNTTHITLLDTKYGFTYALPYILQGTNATGAFLKTCFKVTSKQPELKVRFKIMVNFAEFKPFEAWVVTITGALTTLATRYRYAQLAETFEAQPDVISLSSDFLVSEPTSSTASDFSYVSLADLIHLEDHSGVHYSDTE